MKRLFILAVFFSLSFGLLAQTDTTWKKEYRETATRINDLVHTKLEVRFDYGKSYLYGKAWITLKPHFYPTDSLALDAKGMIIHKVALVKGNVQKELNYTYDDWVLNIRLDKTYKNSESYTVFVDYTSRPNEVKTKGSAAITEAKGLYFINPDGEDKTKPIQIWTQGETEASSVWFPTIDRPNQKTTQEIYMTVPAKYVSLSNGKLISQKKNADGTRTDYWKMDLPHSPYLFFMGVGDYAVIKDSYKGKEVSYYVEKDYATVARKIFGNTPEMMAFFSRITGVDYPWVKYAQITGQDYVSGAMENTTSTLHSSTSQQDLRELLDGNIWEDVIAHELFHQWFGDLVTAESWSNITVNESFADYSETLWNEYKYGKDAGDARNYSGMQGYLGSNSGKKDLVRFYYGDKEDVFDAVSYNKGGRILHMLRNFVGDSAFFKALNLYLTTNKFKSGEAHQLRLAFEEVSGRDLSWYFNQWYFGSGNPNLDIQYSYDETAKKARVIVSQLQADKVFKLPVAVDVYLGASKTRYSVWVKNKIDTFYFDSPRKPDLVNFDGDKILLCTKKENKTLDEYIHQYTYAGSYVDRREAIDFASKDKTNPRAAEFLVSTLRDRYHALRMMAIGRLDFSNESVKSAASPILAEMAKADPRRLVRAVAISKLGQLKDPAYSPLFKAAAMDSSYSVAGAALESLTEVDPDAAAVLVKELEKFPAKGGLKEAIETAKAASGDESMAEEMIGGFRKLPLSQEKFARLASLAVYLGTLKNADLVKGAIDDIVSFRDGIPASVKGQTDPYINSQILKAILDKKEAALKSNASDSKLKELVDYIKSKIPADEKKGF